MRSMIFQHFISSSSPKRTFLVGFALSLILQVASCDEAEVRDSAGLVAGQDISGSGSGGNSGGTEPGPGSKELDCNGTENGTAYIDQCGKCVEGTTETLPCKQDCDDVWGGQARKDMCGQCAGATTGRVACARDCAGIWGGIAAEDACGLCAGGTTNRVHVTDIALCDEQCPPPRFLDNCGNCDADPTNDCRKDPCGIWGGTGYFDECYVCDDDPQNDNEYTGDPNGSGNPVIPLEICPQDCADKYLGDAFLDTCNQCIASGELPTVRDCAGNCPILSTGLPNNEYGASVAGQLCNHECVGKCDKTPENELQCKGNMAGQYCITTCNNAVKLVQTPSMSQWEMDRCGVCDGDPTNDNQFVGDSAGNATTKLCMDCQGVTGGHAYLDACNVCVEGSTGKQPCIKDCNGDWGGEAYVDDQCPHPEGDPQCCVGGESGRLSYAPDCFGEVGGSAYDDPFCPGQCIGGATGKTACMLDCNGDWGGTALVDACGICAGGNTTRVFIDDGADCAPCSAPNTLDKCGNCDDDPTNNCAQDECGIWGGGGGTDICGVCDDDSSNDNQYLTSGLPCLLDCFGNPNGGAERDACGLCAGGNTGQTPQSDARLCQCPGQPGTIKDCAGVCGGNAYCASCSDTRTCNSNPALPSGYNIEGNTVPDWYCGDGSYCFREIDNHGVLADEFTPYGFECKSERTLESLDGIFDQCGTCQTDWNQACFNGCSPDQNWDNCGNCWNSEQAAPVCVQDCFGLWGGEAYMSECKQGETCSTTAGTPVSFSQACVGGNTGLWYYKFLCRDNPSQNSSDCINGACSKYFDMCGSCGSDSTDECKQDCLGIWGGEAIQDPCGNCSGGTTGIEPCDKDCNGDWRGTALVDACEICAGGNTGREPCKQDCRGVWGGLHQIRTCTIVDTGTTPSLCMPQKKIPVEETTSNIDCTETEITNAPTDNSYTCEVICPDPSSDCFWWNSNGECEYKAVCPNGEQMDCRGICVVGSPTYNFDDCDICDDDATNDCQL